MRKWLYARLAFTNIRKNARTYYPYILAGSATVMMFYNLLYLLMSREMKTLYNSQTVTTVLKLGSIVTGFFAVILLLYINSFLIKRRKKEFGLFNILGMEKKHIARIMLIETIVTGLCCIGLGIAAGILFGKLALLLLLNLLDMEASYGFEVPTKAVAVTATLFGASFLVNLVYNVFQVHLSKPVELLKGSHVGEKEPRAKWLIALIGIGALAAGYWIALTVQSPLQALNLFFLAVLLVIIGTYGLFTAGSIALLKILRRNRRFYYRPDPFIVVSGMIYRMKQNAASLASICILSTMVIVMLSSTVALYAGLEDVLRSRFPRDITVTADFVTDEQARELENLAAETAQREGFAVQNAIRLRYLTEIALQDGQAFTMIGNTLFTDKNASFLLFVPVEEYNRIENARAALSEGEVLLYAERGHIPGDVLQFGDVSLTVRERLDGMDLLEKTEMNSVMPNSYVVITSGERDIFRIRRALYGTDELEIPPHFRYQFDTSGDAEAQRRLVSVLRNQAKELSFHVRTEGRETYRQDFLSAYGSLFFLGLFLGALFILGTVLIIYYKQITEGYDDKERFAIMRKIGLDRGEIRRTIRFQVLLVFFLPLAMAVCHIAAAFPVISKLLALFSMTNVPLFAVCTALTILAFGLCYALIYGLTARTYYRIVR
jgi:putative ABC transport system permease protein